MTFSLEYIQQLEAFAARSPIPKIRALHLPPVSALSDNRGEFCALELEDGSIGQSYVLFDNALQRLHASSEHLDLSGTDALALARHYAAGEGPLRELGFAAANALTQCLFQRAGFVPPDSVGSLGNLQPTAGESIGMIGLFKPLLQPVLRSGAHLTVVELNPDLITEAAGYRVTLDAGELAGCTQVISTSTLLLNHTLDRMLQHCRTARWFGMLGPSAGCLPDALFERGVSLIGGSAITDRAGFVDALRSGTSRHAFTRKFSLSPDNYPGFDALLYRIGD
jgi:uncharacterized protein (DUF4213/DUF364 family)